MKEIPLTQGKVALVDDADYEYLNQFKWYVYQNHSGIFYAATYGKPMHRMIMGIKNPKIIIDHEDHDGLNNQRYNLRVATHSQNMANRSKRVTATSKYLGVHLHQSKGYTYWYSQIRTNGVKKSLGYFKTEEEAAMAYDEAASIYHGEFANLNFKKRN